MDQVRKKSERELSYKLKSSTVDKRALRAHRRSLEWKQMRDVNRSVHRKIDSKELSPLKEKAPSNAKKDPVRERLQKWREEKELKKKLEAKEKAKHKPFKVTHLKEETVAFSRPFVEVPKPKVKPVANKKQPEPVPKRKLTVPKTPSVARKVTVAAAGKRVVNKNQQHTDMESKKQPLARNLKATVPSKKQEKVEVKPPARSTRRITRSQAAQQTTSDTAKVGPAVSKKAKTSSTVKKDDTVEKKRSTLTKKNAEASFAPASFEFAAPESLKSFSFAPLSPASANSFLFGTTLPSSSAGPLSARRCSTPVSALSSKPPKVVHSPVQGAITEVQSASDSDAPVLSLVEEIHKQSSSTAKKRRSSRKSLSSKSTDSEDEKPLKKSQTDVKSTSADDAITKHDEVMDCLVEPVDDVKKSHSAKKRRRSSRRSVSKALAQSEDATVDMSQPGLSEMDVDEQKNRPSELSGMSGEPKVVGVKSKSDSATPNERVTGGLGDLVFPSTAATPGSILRTGGKGRVRTKSLQVTFSAGRPMTSGKTPGRNNRCSLLLRQLSPEEGVEILRNSPMVELGRRTHTPGSGRRSVGTPRARPVMPVPPMLSLDDLEQLPAPEELGTGEELDRSVCAITEALVEQDEEDAMDVDPPAQAEAMEETNGGPIQSDAAPVSVVMEDPPKVEEPEVHDVAYFRGCVVRESAMLDELCARWEEASENLPGDVGEDVRGQIRTVIGKAQLLTGRKGRFTQFSTLVDDCDFKRGEKEVTTGDLQGFWDMVYFQVEDVHAMFGDLDKLRDRGWQLETKAKPKPKKKVVKKPAAAAGSKKPAAGRSKFAAFKAQMMKEKAAVDSDTDLLQLPETKEFEAGFFKVRSPVRQPEAPEVTTGATDTPTRAPDATDTASPGLRKQAMRRSAVRRSMSSRLELTPTPGLMVAAAASPSIFTPDSLEQPQPARSRRASRRSTAAHTLTFDHEAADENEPKAAADVSFSMFLQPSKSVAAAAVPAAESALDSATKTRPSHVTFNSDLSPDKEAATLKVPLTPYNHSADNLLVATETPAGRMSRLTVAATPTTHTGGRSRAGKRVSCFTPARPLGDIDVADNLMCFSPLAEDSSSSTNQSAAGGRRTPAARKSTRRSTRISLL